jgi:hypothetical protein
MQGATGRSSQRPTGRFFYQGEGVAMTLSRIVGVVAVTLAIAGVLMNLADIKRYIKISSM